MMYSSYDVNRRRRADASGTLDERFGPVTPTPAHHREGGVRAPAAIAARAATYAELTKPRITALVVASAAAAYVAAAGGEIAAIRLVGLLLGTAMAAGGTNALNQWWERDADARMDRTSGRPLPSGRLSPRAALGFGTALAAAGVVVLAATTTAATAVLAAGTVLLYVLVYTPLKRRSAACTYVGALPGALPVLGGWAAHGQGLAVAGWGLFGVLLLWQLPHFFALEWLARGDYRRAGFRTVAAGDPSGRASSRHAAACAALLVPVSFLPLADPALGGLYAAAAAAAGLGFAAPCVGFLLRRERTWARRLFGASLAYLPVVLAAAAVDVFV